MTGVSRCVSDQRPVTHRCSPLRARLPRLALGGSTLLFLAAGSAVAQTTDDINSLLQFNFSNPGARSLALAGAFTARADDATAVYANPAGLLQLSEVELSLDLRGWSYSNRFLDGGVQQSTDRFDGLSFDETDDSVEGVSFASGIYPGNSGRWVVGIFEHQLANFVTEVHSGGAQVRTATGFAALSRPIDGIYDLRITNVGLAAAGRLNKNLSLGLSLAWSTFDLESRTERLDALRADAEADRELRQVIEVDPEICCRFGLREDVITFQTQETDPENDQDLAWTAGLLWHSSRKVEGFPVVSAGAVYRRGPEFGFVGNSFTRAFGSAPGGQVIRTYLSQLQDPGDPEACKQQGRDGCPGNFKVPDVTGLGVSFRPSLRWVIAVDYNRVEYSDLLDRTLDIVNADRAIPEGKQGTPTDFEIEDGDELRLGVEVAFYRERRLPDVFVRAGAWLDPDHKLRYVGPSPALRAIWAPGDDEIHYAAGIGFRFRRFQLDAAIDLSELRNTVSVSSVIYLGR